MTAPATVVPVCRHFGVCGGCSAQDVAPAALAEAKHARLAAALARAGFADPHPAPEVSIPMGTRRRADFAVARVAGAVRLGFHETRSRTVVDIAECPLLRPELEALIDPLRALLARLQGLRKSADVRVNLLDAGADVSVALDGEATAADRARLVAFAQEHDLPRISLGAEPVLIRRPPTLDCAGLVVLPPPAAFLQPSFEGEAAIRAAVLAGLPPKLTRKSRIVELYAGIGTLTGALAAHARVHAVEGSAPALAALDEAARTGGQAGRIDTERRDLARRPVTAKELAGAACVVLDPPFDGAGPQIAPLVEAKVQRIVYVSCNPEALAREAAPFARAGYRLLASTPIDQFPGSDHLESVVVLGL
ncbi:class I SAM-dependent RNA methyltransferase [Acidiphilium sp. JA12-A1]|uniref:class I SAM-dependent RNA methyltransferase n=1 Tax=Acidiphilium sp. JA12-A1 TaxID=1464546 RepID=UPI0004611ECA|nr:class I SAM-dependent RNA methyltransferase [Acidiphilium sp. JA12-A1]KDM67583.1 23S rRNA m(5)U-1939 methyltransferase [Acidiphilium sp. JA12-A1]